MNKKERMKILDERLNMRIEEIKSDIRLIQMFKEHLLEKEQQRRERILEVIFNLFISFALTSFSVLIDLITESSISIYSQIILPFILIFVLLEYIPRLISGDIK